MTSAAIQHVVLLAERLEEERRERLKVNKMGDGGLMSSEGMGWDVVTPGSDVM